MKGMTKVEALNIVRPLPLTVDDFLLLDSSGAFEGYGKTELIEGSVVYKNAQHRPHARVKAHLSRELDQALRAMGSPLAVLTEVTVSIPPHNAPEPDLVITSEPDGEGPVPVASVALVVEIADTTLEHDLGTKAALYARAGVHEYWVADVQGRTLRQLWGAGEASYANARDVAFGEAVAYVGIDGVQVVVGGV